MTNTHHVTSHKNQDQNQSLRMGLSNSNISRALHLWLLWVWVSYLCLYQAAAQSQSAAQSTTSTPTSTTSLPTAPCLFPFHHDLIGNLPLGLLPDGYFLPACHMARMKPGQCGSLRSPLKEQECQSQNQMHQSVASTTTPR